MTALLVEPDLEIHCGDARAVLAGLPASSVHAVMTSPPFYGLRDYGTGRWEGGDPACEHRVGGQVQDSKAPGAITTGMRPGADAWRCRACGARRVDEQIGLERSPEEWAAAIVDVMREARRVLRDDGTLWVEVGDSYASRASGRDSRGDDDLGRPLAHRQPLDGARHQPTPAGVKDKDMVGAPWLLAFALRADGWYLRGEYVWEKPDAMPESMRDRCTTSHSRVFHFSQRPRYYFDREAILEPFADYSGGGDGGSYGARADEARPPTGGPRGSATYLRNGDGHPPGTLTLDGQEHEPEPRGPDGRRELHLEAGPNSHQHRDGSRWPSLEGRSPRSVWRITTESSSFGLCPSCRTYWPERAPREHCGVEVVAHFAVWPHALVGKIIACATSEAGCCGDCGAPRARVVDREREDDHETTGAPGIGRRDVQGYGVGSGPRSLIEHRGWQATCGCGAPTVPCSVLDPFAGSGTTARQARAMGRRAVLVELSPDYAEIALHRTAQQSLLSTS